MADAIAIITLAGMMLIPGINVLVGIVAGGASFGVSGGFAGGAIAVLITFAEKWLSDRHPLGAAQANPSAQIIAISNRPYWRPVPDFESSEAISAALSKLASQMGTDSSVIEETALAA
jgi:hypothetical protein